MLIGSPPRTSNDTLPVWGTDCDDDLVCRGVTDETHDVRSFHFAAERPWLYRLGTAAAVRAMRLFRRGGWIGRMPFAGAWTRYRDLPAPAGRTFMEQLRDRERGR